MEVDFNTNVIIKKNKMICNSHPHNADSNKKLYCKQTQQEDFKRISCARLSLNDDYGLERSWWFHKGYILFSKSTLILQRQACGQDKENIWDDRRRRVRSN